MNELRSLDDVKDAVEEWAVILRKYNGIKTSVTTLGKGIQTVFQQYKLEELEMQPTAEGGFEL